MTNATAATVEETVVVTEPTADAAPAGADAPAAPKAPRDIQAEIQALLAQKEEVAKDESMDKAARDKKLRSIRTALRQRGYYIQGQRPKAEAGATAEGASTEGEATGSEVTAEGYETDNAEMAGPLSDSPLVDEVAGNTPGEDGADDEEDDEF